MSDQLPPQPPVQPPVPPQQPVEPPQQPAYQQPPQQPYATNPAPQPAQPLTPAEDKQWAMWAHFGGILWILPSLIIYLVFKDRGAFTKQESKEALNWQITFLIVYVGWIIVLTILTGILIATGAWTLISIFGWVGWLLYIANVVFSILGGVKVNGGGSYRYPVNFRFIK